MRYGSSHYLLIPFETYLTIDSCNKSLVDCTLFQQTGWDRIFEIERMKITHDKNPYREVKILLELGQIKSFDQILKNLPIAALAKDMKLKGDAKAKEKELEILIKDPFKLTLDQVFRLSELLEYDFKKILVLAGKFVAKSI